VKTIPILSVCLLALVAPFNGGVIALGLQKKAGPVSFLFQYMLALPLAALLGLKYGLGTRGFWTAEIFGIVGAFAF